MSDLAQNSYVPGLSRKFQLIDFSIMLFCLLGSVYSAVMFRSDLFQALETGNGNPVGTVIAGSTVQRLMADWLLWDNLTLNSHIYTGDTIRTADRSGETLSIERNSVKKKKKTLIRIQRSPGDEDTVLIYLDEGNLILTTVAGGGNIALNLTGRQVETGPGTVLTASAGKDGAVLQVSEGTAILTGDGQRREIAPGTTIALDSGGALTDIILTEPLKVADTPEPAATTIEQPVPLPAPLNRLPPAGHRIGIEQRKESNSIDFSWSAVTGANAYIFTIYEQTADGRRQIIRTPPENRRNWTLENIATLGNGTFIWQVEAVNSTPAGTVERRGRIAENYFVIEIPRSGTVEINEQ
jgi:hypothetical protein